MKSVLSYLLIFAMILFWIFRVIVTLTTTMGIEMGFVSVNPNFEIVTLFITLVCIILIFKRHIIGAIAYLISQCAYFGFDLYDVLIKTTEGENVVINYTEIFIAAVAIILPIAIFFDIIITKTSDSAGASNKKTDWFYKNKDFDRVLDERADKNNYKF